MRMPSPTRTSWSQLPLALAMALAVAPPAASQTPPPGTDIFLLPLSVEAGEIRLGEPVQVTARTGYDNQPSFTSDSRFVLFTAIHGEEPADSYRYEIATASTVQLTYTAEAEYSPTMMPGDTSFSVIRVEADGTQRLWAFDSHGENPRILLPEIQPVGYHAWLADGTLALFVLGDPASLQIVPPGRQRGMEVAWNIGRSLHRIPASRTFSFVQWEKDGGGRITSYDPETGEIAPLAPMLAGNEYCAWTPDGTLLMADEAGIHAWSGQGDTGDWRLIPGLAPGLGAISRMAVSPDGRWLAVVVSEEG